MASAAPIIVFAYRRPEHLRKTLQSLIDCEGFEESDVIVYGDGPKDAQEHAITEATRQVAMKMLGSRAEYHFRDSNVGLSGSVIDGVTDVTRRFRRAIVIEDDLTLAPGFLAYMNSALERYAEHPAVFQVSGYMFDVPDFARRREALFLPLTVSWGWATWQRAWERFDPTATGWKGLTNDMELRRCFNLSGAYDFAGMLEDQMAGRADSWAVRWYWTVFRAGGLVLFPPRRLVENTGMDGSGTHGRGRLTRFGAKHVAVADAPAIELPAQVAQNEADFALVREAIWRQNGGWLGQAKMRLRRLSKSKPVLPGTEQ
jgi:hypothetical protein